jgi:F420-0:gamma-glutamyl ligase
MPKHVGVKIWNVLKKYPLLPRAFVGRSANNIKTCLQMLYNPLVIIIISDYSKQVSHNRVLNVATLRLNVRCLKQVTSDYSRTST